ncbi:hypothetical protein BKA83DRAFT_4492709 [Pisolithus microcarpus]|nr:hypothetical protein BKA83DRAFT_4492709 [Pisolithus microcarpus]
MSWIMHLQSTLSFCAVQGDRSWKLQQWKGMRGRAQQRIGRKHKHTDEVLQRCTAPQIEQDHEDDYNPSQFLQPPLDEELKECYAGFFKVTSSSALESATCGVCAHDCSVSDDRLVKVYLDLLPNVGCLIPKKPHHAHDLFDGKLLDPSGVETIGGCPLVLICSSCLEELKKSSNKTVEYKLPPE